MYIFAKNRIKLFVMNVKDELIDKLIDLAFAEDIHLLQLEQRRKVNL